MQLVKVIVLFIKLKTGVTQKRVGAENQRAAKEREAGECGTGSWRLWGKSCTRSSSTSYEKEVPNGKQEQIQQVVRFTDN